MRRRGMRCYWSLVAQLRRVDMGKRKGLIDRLLDWLGERTKGWFGG